MHKTKSTIVGYSNAQEFTNEANTAFVELGLVPVSFNKLEETYSQWEIELQGLVSSFLGISPDSVQIVEVVPYKKAEFIICGGNIASFLNAVQQNDTAFENTMLEGSFVENVLWGYPCEDEYDFVFSHTLEINESPSSYVAQRPGFVSSEFVNGRTSDLYFSPSSLATKVSFQFYGFCILTFVLML